MMELQIEKFRNVETPAKSHAHDAGFDFFLPKDMPDVFIGYGVRAFKLPLGIAAGIPEGYFLAITLRSSTAKNTMLRLSNSMGVVDSGYTGEICLLLDNIGETMEDNVLLKAGQRIAQGMLLPVPELTIREVQTLPPSGRGKGGFGSTGK